MLPFWVHHCRLTEILAPPSHSCAAHAREGCSSKLYASEAACLTLVALDLFIHDVPCGIH